MAELYKFPSLAFSDKYGYRFDTSHTARSPQVHEAMVFFETYGDGMVQHAYEQSIIPELAADYFASLAAWLIANPDDVDKVRFSIPNFSGAEKDFAFAASVIYKAPPEGKYEKPRYYSLEEKKITSSESKQHDKRYDRIASWMDGKAESIMRLLWKSYERPLDIFARHHALRDWANREADRPWVDMPKLGQGTSREDAWSQDGAWHLLRSVINHLEGMAFCRRGVESWQENIKRQQERAVAEKTEAA